MLQGPMQRQRFWVAKAVAKVAVAKPAATINENYLRPLSDADLRGIRAGGYDKCTPLSAKTTKELSRADAILRNDHRRIGLVSARRSRSPKLLPKPPASCPPLHLRIESPLHLRIEYLVSRRASGMTADDCSHDEMLIYQTIVDEIGEKKLKDCSEDELSIYKNIS
jgi:hypothetical protein